MELFSKQGYPSTSVANIAKSAGITEMTFYRHFPSKEAVLLSDPFDPIIADYVARQNPDKKALHAVVGGFREAWGETEPTIEHDLKARLKIIAETPELKRASFASTNATADAVKTALIARGSSEIKAAAVASAVLAALSSALLVWAAADNLSVGVAIRDTLAALEATSE